MKTKKINDKTIESIAKGIQFVLGFFLIVAVVYFLFGVSRCLFSDCEKKEINQNEPKRTKFEFKECQDWQSDSTVSMERRNVYKYWQGE